MGISSADKNIVFLFQIICIIGFLQFGICQKVADNNNKGSASSNLINLITGVSKESSESRALLSNAVSSLARTFFGNSQSNFNNATLTQLPEIFGLSGYQVLQLAILVVIATIAAAIALIIAESWSLKKENDNEQYYKMIKTFYATNPPVVSNSNSYGPPQYGPPQPQPNPPYGGYKMPQQPQQQQGYSHSKSDYQEQFQQQPVYYNQPQQQQEYYNNNLMNTNTGRQEVYESRDLKESKDSKRQIKESNSFTFPDSANKTKTSTTTSSGITVLQKVKQKRKR